MTESQAGASTSATSRAATGARAATPRPDDGEAQPTRAPDPLIGKTIADRYRIVAPLGKGGMGVVYKVEHLRIGKLMAMKLLTGELSRNRDVVRRFKREALAASRLTSINTVQVWDFGHSDGLTYLVMELVQGEDFGKVLKLQGPLPFSRVAKIAVQVCNSLIEAHARGIIHRDLKPENLLIVDTGGNDEGRELQELVKVLDFGLAKLHEDDRPNPSDITSTGAIVGTPYYMAPEQIRGEQVDGRADLYALGAVMYRAVTGSPPFTGHSPMAVLTQHLTEPLIPPDERMPELHIPKEASEIICQAMAKTADERWESAAVLRDALISYLTMTGVSGGFLRSGRLEALTDATTSADTTQQTRVSTAKAPVEKPATRSEVDAYARRIRRNGIVAAVMTIALVGLAVWVVKGWRKSVAAHAIDGEEPEPNNSISTPNALSIGTPIRGYLGKRIAPDVGDVDVFAVEVPPSSERQLLEIDLGAVPNLPLCLELIDSDATPPLGTFCRARGRALHVEAFAVAPGKHFLRVSQDRSVLEGAERPPVYENVSDPYSLRVALASRTGELEVEPNDRVDQAQSLAPSTTVNGRLAWRDDRDAYCAGKGPGTARFVVVDRAHAPRGPAAQLSVEPSVGGVAGQSVVLGASALPKTGGVGGGPLNDGSYVGKPFSLEGPAQCLTVRLARGGDATGDETAYQVTLEKLTP